MFSRILSRKKKSDGTGANPANSSPSTPTTPSANNNRRSPSAEREGAQVSTPKSMLFLKTASDSSRSKPPSLRSLTPPSTTSASHTYEGMDPRILSLPKQLGVKKASEPNVLHAKPHLDKLRKSNSQPIIQTRKSTDISRSSRSKRKEDESTGFLDRAFENAASVVFEELEQQAGRADSSASSGD